MNKPVSLRALSSAEEFGACVDLQKEIWGHRFNDIVPASLLLVSQKIGSLLAGAFDETGCMLGFVYSLYGRLDDRPIHWSHMLAVTQAARGAGLGRALKLHQRERVLEDGIHTILWTYDPLVARNAHMNLNRLGATIADFRPNLYGSDTGSLLHGSDETDRFVARWELESERARHAIAGGFRGPPPEATGAPAVGLRAEEEPGAAPRESGLFPPGPIVRVEVPADFETLLLETPAEAGRWRLSTREAFRHYLGNGYEVDGLYRDPASGRCFYWLVRAAD